MVPEEPRDLGAKRRGRVIGRWGGAMRTWRKADVTDAHPWVSSGSDSLAPGIIGCG